MRLIVAYYSATAMGLFGAGRLDLCSAETQLVMKDRSYYAWGYEGGTTEGVPNGYAFGIGGLEKTSYDSKERILYGVSEAGFITLIDYGGGFVQPPQLPIVMKDQDTYTDVHVCSEQGVLFASTKDDPNLGSIAIYKAATRVSDTIAPPELIHTVQVGYGPDMIIPNKDCSILAVANEGEGDYEDFLINPEGSVSLVKGPFLDASTSPIVSTVTFPWTDADLLAKGIHLPLSENALEYWDDYSSIADDIDFTAARANYTTASVLEPEYLAWSADDTYVLVSLQENSALVKINVATEEAEDIYSYGLKSWEETPIDIIEDDGCSTMPTVAGLYSTQSPDAIKAIIIGEDTYIAVANEGDDVEYGDFAERLKAEEVFSGTALLQGMTADSTIFDPASPLTGQAKYFNSECEAALEAGAADAPEWCASSLRLTIGSSMVDYSDPTAPVIKKIVALGGRGISIYKLNDDGLELVWDSADEFEKEGCAAYPWAHNGLQDEEFADVNGTLYMSNEDIQETLIEMNDPEEDGCEDRGDGQPGACALGDTVDERSLKDGPGAEGLAVGEACGKRYLVTAGEKNSIGFLYDISDITSPKLVQLFHLSPASETKNPVVAYEDRTLGEIDPESIIFLGENESPSGNAAIIFAGAFSSTTSYWEFDCGSGAVTLDTSAAEDALTPGTAPEAAEGSAPAEAAPSTSSSAFLATGSLASLAAAFILFIAV